MDLQENRSKVLISACLLGRPVRYDGQDNRLDDRLLQRWIKQQRVVPICPEMSGGLAVPRAPAEIAGEDGFAVIAGQAGVMDSNGQDVTEQFIAGANKVLALCRLHHIRVAILVESSPSCGSSTIHDGTFSGIKKPGSGVTAACLRQHGVKVFNQFEVANAARFL